MKNREETQETRHMFLYLRHERELRWAHAQLNFSHLCPAQCEVTPVSLCLLVI